MDRTWRDDRSAFEAALESLRWRGPDGVGRAEAGRWRLGVARLAITDAAAPQPCRCPDTGRVALWNGADTGADADRARRPTRTRNDTELLLARLAGDGPRGIPPRTGHGAGAVVDPAADVIWLFRDPCGEKPLYLALAAGRLVAFASTLRALRALGVEAALPRAALAALLRTGFCPSSWTGSAGLEVVALDERAAYGEGWPAPRARVHVQQGSGRLTEVDGPVADGPSGGHRGGERDSEGEGHRDDPAPTFRDAFEQAVTRTATAEVPVALSLSGGLDSGCIAAALARAGLRPRAYQFWAGGDRAERGRAEAVAAHLGLDLTPVDGGSEILDALPALTAAHGQPLGDPSVLAMHRVARAAASDGHKVLLSGEGGDEFWLGYRRHRLALRFGGRTARTAKRVAAGLGLGRAARGGLGLGAVARVRRALASADPYAALLEVAPPAFVAAVYSEEIAEREPRWPEPRVAGITGPLRRAAWFDQHVYLRHDLLPKNDVATMAAGVEGRCPFLDAQVRRASAAAFAGPDPAQILGKQPLRAFEADLPPGFFDQPKQGFGLPLDRWLREDANAVLDLLADRATQQRAHLRPGGLARMLDRHRRGQADLGHALYLVAALEAWLREGGTLCG